MHDELSAIPLHFVLDEKATAYCDPFQIQQVLLILVRRAYTSLEKHKAPHITITTLVHGEAIRVRVMDNGPGLPSSGRDPIFGALQFTEELGIDAELALCRTIVEAHGGRLEVSNRLPCGVNYFFDLPMHKTG